MWNAFAGYTDVYGELPDDDEVQRVRIFINEKTKWEVEEQKKARKEQEETRRQLQNKLNSR